MHKAVLPLLAIGKKRRWNAREWNHCLQILFAVSPIAATQLKERSGKTDWEPKTFSLAEAIDVFDPSLSVITASVLYLTEETAALTNFFFVAYQAGQQLMRKEGEEEKPPEFISLPVPSTW